MRKFILRAGGLLLIFVVFASLWLWWSGADTRPWINEPLLADVPQSIDLDEVRKIAARDPSVLVAVTLSGGGARAAAFGYGVLKQLEATKFQWHGRDTDLLDEIDVVAGVSGGSIMAAYFAAFGASGFERFEREFLLQDFQETLILDALRPTNLYRLSSPWFGRSHLLANRLDELFQGRTFGDVMRRPRHPQLLISATDASQGAVFDFTASQFELLCSDIATVPLSFAVAASSGVPLVLSPMTLRNHSQFCRQHGIEQRRPILRGNDYRSRIYALQQQSYLDPKARPYIHLIDGAMADNLGVRRMLDRALAGEGFRESFHEVGIEPGSVKRLILITVNAEGDSGAPIGVQDEVPGILSVIDAIRYAAISRRTNETQQYLSDLARQWGIELKEHASGQDIFARDARVFVVPVNLRDVGGMTPDGNSLLHIPTSLSLSPENVRQLISAGRATLENSPVFKELKADLGATVAELP